MKNWDDVPSESEFLTQYYQPISREVDPVYTDFEYTLYQALTDLDWKRYRMNVLQMNSDQIEKRLSDNILKVENLFGFKLEGSSILFGAFSSMDGYARFNQGKHQVYLGLDEIFNQGYSADILMTHELTHVARESRESVWEGWGLNPKMSHDDFVESSPVIEHLIGEGLSCAASEILIPHQSEWEYVYQSKEGLNWINAHAKALDREVRKELKNPQGHYFHLYQTNRYGKKFPDFSHYVWAWQWVKSLLKDKVNPKKLVSECSKIYYQDAIQFCLCPS